MNKSWRLAWWGSTEKEASHLLGLRARHQYPNQRSSRIKASCVASTAAGTGGGPNGQAVSIKRAADRKRQSREMIDKMREKYGAKNGSLRNTSTDSKGTTFVIVENYASAPLQKERLIPRSKARREASQNRFPKKGGVPNRVKSFGEVDSSKNHPRVRLGFIRPIRNGLRKVQNLIKSRPSSAETGLTGLQKEE